MDRFSMTGQAYPIGTDGWVDRSLFVTVKTAPTGVASDGWMDRLSFDMVKGRADRRCIGWMDGSLVI
jgi:hypothetical protein